MINSVRTDARSFPPLNLENGSFKTVNAAAAMLMSFAGRILIERSFFQNVQISTDVLLHLANDLIKTIAPQRKEMFSMAKEVSLLYKQMRGRVLTKEELDYLDQPAELDVLQEIGNGLRYSSAVLLGQSFYTSITSAAKHRLWAHIPAICGYFGLSIAGPHALSYAVNKVLQNRGLTQEQRELVEPWLSTVGRLALGFAPKVHATDRGVHYHYPSWSGYSQTVSADQTATLSGDTVIVEKLGHLDTDQGQIPGTYEAHFKLGCIQELSLERIHIEVVNVAGVKFPVMFTRKVGQFGPEISISSPDQDLQDRWTQYFHPHQVPALPSPEEGLSEKLSCRNGISPRIFSTASEFPKIPLAVFDSQRYQGGSNFHLLSGLYITLGLWTGGRRQNAYPLTALAGLLPLLMPQGVKADVWSDAVDFFKHPGKPDFSVPVRIKTPNLEDAIEKFGGEARLLMEEAGKMIDGRLEKVVDNIGAVGAKFIGDFGEMGKVVISQAGSEFRVSVEHLSAEAQKLLKAGGQEAKAILQVAGIEARFTIAEAGKEARATLTHLRQEVQLIVKDIERGSERVLTGAIENAGRQADRLILDFGQQGQLMIEKAGDTFRTVADDTLKRVVSGSEMVLKTAASESRLTISAFGDETRVTIGKGGEEVRYTLDHAGRIVHDLMDKFPETTGRSAEVAGKSFINGLISALWGHSQVEEVRQRIDEFIISKDALRQDKLASVRKLLSFVYSQTQAGLSPKEKASLYVHVIRHVNKPGNEEDTKWMLFFIACVASQDENLTDSRNYLVYSTKTEYFKTMVLPAIPNRQVREAVQRNEYQALVKEGLEYMVRQSDAFRRLIAGPSTQAIPFSDVVNIEDLNTGVGIPVGGVVAYASDLVPQDYVACDGALYPKDEYPELYRVLQTRYGPEETIDGKVHFRVPDFRDMFLRGSGDVVHVGTFEEATTAMPQRKFTTELNGAHVHAVLNGGAGTHESTLAGTHSHTVEPAGRHTHTVSSDGKHKHALTGVGNHQHVIHNTGRHSHSLAAFWVPSPHARDTGREEYRYSVSRDKHELIAAEGRSLPSDGDHTHPISEAGAHTHEMGDSDVHTHTLSDDSPHTHKLSVDQAHTHKVTLPDHTHNMREAGDHTHTVLGGDAETRPANRRVAYLIKAKPTVAASADEIAHLQDQIAKLQEQLMNPFTQPSVLLNTLLVGIAGVLALGFGCRSRRA